MSYAVHAYAIDLVALGKIAGSGNAVLAKRLVNRFARELQQIDDVDFEPGPTRAAEILTRLVVEGLPDGADAGDEPGYKWGYALELVCRELSEPLPSRVFSGMGSELFDALDAALARAKNKRRVSAIFFDGAPLPLPEIEDFPAIGHLTPAEVLSWREDIRALLGERPAKKKGKAARGKAARKEEEQPAAFSGRVVGTSLVLVRAGKTTKKKFPTKKAAQAALLEALRAANRGGEAAPESEATEAFRELLGWLDEAAAKELGLVTFYY